MRIIVYGITGHMGRIVASLLDKGFGGHSLAAGVSPNAPAGFGEYGYASLADFPGEADCVVDFSRHDAVGELLDWCVEKKLPLVIATTGHTPSEKAAIAAAAERIPIFFSANMSVGVALLVKMARETTKMFPDADIEIVEAHHNRKLDVPSGTALMIAEELRSVRPEAELVIGRHENGRRKKTEIGIHSLRLGNEVGSHEVIVSAGSQTITLRHQAEDRALFAEGALTAASFLEGRGPGLYGMKDLIGGTK